MTTTDLPLSLSLFGWIIHNHTAQLCPPPNEKTHGRHNCSVTAFGNYLKLKEEPINTTAGTNLSFECSLSATRG